LDSVIVRYGGVGVVSLYIKKKKQHFLELKICQCNNFKKPVGDIYLHNNAIFIGVVYNPSEFFTA